MESYVVNLTNGNVFCEIPPGTVNQQSSMVLIGRNYSGYGQQLADNFIHLLENAADNTPPPAPVVGQLWFNSTSKTIFVWDGSVWDFHSNTANTVTGNVQSNITSLGNLTGLTVSGNTQSNVIRSDNYCYANGAPVSFSANVAGTVYQVDTGVGLTGGPITLTGNISIANTGVANGTYGSANTVSVVTVNDQGQLTSASNVAISITTNEVSGLGTIATQNSNNVAITGGTFTTTANISAGNILTNNYRYANGVPVTFGGTSNYGNSNVASYLPTNTANIGAGNIAVTGNISTGNISVTGNVTTTRILTNNYLYANGVPVSFGGSSSYGNSNVAAYLPTNTANVAAGNILTNNYLYANGTPVNFGNVSSLSSANVTYTAPFAGATQITGTSKWSQFVSVLDFGADPTGVSDSRGAFNAALLTAKHVYIPTGTYRINSQLTVLYPGQMISGDGRDASVIIVDSAFNLSGSAVFNCDGLQPGVQLRDFGITFTQPDTSSRGSLTAYPVAISAVASPRTTIQNLKIQGAIDGIDMTDNSGGTFIDLLEMSAFGTGIAIDGSIDTVRINKFHFWPFNLSSNQQTIFYSSGTIGITAGRCDGLFINEYLNISNLGLQTFHGTISGLAGDPWVFIENSGFDTHNGIVHQAGSLQVTNSYITVTTAVANLNGYIQTKMASASTSWAQFTNCWFLQGNATTNQSMFLIQQTSGSATGISLNINQCKFENSVSGYPYIYINGANISDSSLQVSDCTFSMTNTNSSVVTANPTASSNFALAFNNNLMQTNTGTTYSTTMFNIVGSGYNTSFIGNKVRNTNGSGSLITVDTGSTSLIALNSVKGWTITPSISTGSVVVADNIT